MSVVRFTGEGALVFPGVTRVTVVDERYSAVFERYDLYEGGVEVHMQDDGKTLKIFPLRKEGY